MKSKHIAVGLFGQYVLAAQPGSLPPIPAPLRELEWGQINFLHTTDTHGWHCGHLQEPSYSADWGDYVSFAEHLRKHADETGTDLLLIDSGDRIEGNGLYDASNPKGKYTYDIFKKQDIDILCTGNHELYKANSSYTELNVTVPAYGNHYLATNIDIRDPSSGEWIPLAHRFRKFTTKNQKIRICAFGFLFDFTGNADNTRVNRVEGIVYEEWFQEVIRDPEIDLFVVVAHIGIRSNNLFEIYHAIREARRYTPIQFFGGHTHIRDFTYIDSTSSAIESGRYLETIGFLSLDGLLTGSDTPWIAREDAEARKRDAKDLDKEAYYDRYFSVFRRYIDNNLYSLHHHSKTTSRNFDTNKGLETSALIAEARSELNLDKVLGCAPRTLWTGRVPFGSRNNIYTWLKDEVFPDVLSANWKRDILANRKEKSQARPRPKLVINNSGSIRFDVFKGNFTVDTTYLISPFTSAFRMISGVPYDIARDIIHILNHDGYYEPNGYHDPFNSVAIQWGGDAPWQQEDYGVNEAVFPGYTTDDDAGREGDDTIHERLQHYGSPNCFQSEVDFPDCDSHVGDESRSSCIARATGEDKVDVVFNAFIEPMLVSAMMRLDPDYEPGRRKGRHYENVENVQDGRPMTDYISEWVEASWPCTEDDLHANPINRILDTIQVYYEPQDQWAPERSTDVKSASKYAGSDPMGAQQLPLEDQPRTSTKPAPFYDIEPRPPLWCPVLDPLGPAPSKEQGEFFPLRIKTHNEHIWWCSFMSDKDAEARSAYADENQLLYFSAPGEGTTLWCSTLVQQPSHEDFTTRRAQIIARPPFEVRNGEIFQPNTTEPELLQPASQELRAAASEWAPPMFRSANGRYPFRSNATALVFAVDDSSEGGGRRWCKAISNGPEFVELVGWGAQLVVPWTSGLLHDEMGMSNGRSVWCSEFVRVHAARPEDRERLVKVIAEQVLGLEPAADGQPLESGVSGERAEEDLEFIDLKR